MKCPNCGKKNYSNDKFCSNCNENNSNDLSNPTLSDIPFPENKNIVEPIPRRYNPSKEINNKRRMHPLLVFFLWILLIIPVISFSYFGFLYFKKVYRTNFPINSTIDYHVEVTKLIQNGYDAHKFLINGMDGDIVSIQGYDKNYFIKDGIVQIILNDQVWQKQNNDIANTAKSITIRTKAKIVKKTGSVISVSIPNFTIQTLTAPFELLNPSATYINTTEANLLLKCKVTPRSKIIINGNDHSYLIDRNGMVQVSIPILPISINKIQIMVASNGYQNMNTTIQINRAPMSIEISLDSIIPSIIDSSAFQITGNTEPGARISINMPLREDLKINPSTGSFKFSPKFIGFGKQSIIITASKENKKNSMLTIQTYYLPTADIYTKSAYKMDYGLLLKYANRWKNKVFLCTGTISNIQQNNDESNFILYIDGNKQKIIYMKYVGNMILKENTNYRIYGDVVGYYNQYPLITARYLYLKK